MPPRTALLLSLALSGCAFAGDGESADAGRADARERADASTAFQDAAAIDAGGTASADASVAPVDAAPGAPDATPIVDTLLITEIVDATLTGGLPKFVEITNLGVDPVALSGYSLGVYNNGATQLLGGLSTVLTGTLAAGDSYVVSFENGDGPGIGTFQSTYGFDPDHFGFGVDINGDDALVLFRADGGGAGGAATGTGADATVVDVYGVVGVDGSGESWEYLDGFATRRQASTTPSASFNVNDWGFSGANALDGMSAAEIAGLTSPGSH